MSHLDEVRLYGSDEMPRTEIELKPGMSIEIRSKAKLKPMHHEETFFDAPYMGATEGMPKGEVRVNASCWRGDTFYYEGSTHYEYPGSFCPEEMYHGRLWQ